MLFSAVDDKSGVAYQEYRRVYGEDVESALRFLFNAMSAKVDQDNPLQGSTPRLSITRLNTSDFPTGPLSR